jgi:hypothetical protein
MPTPTTEIYETWKCMVISVFSVAAPPSYTRELLFEKHSLIDVNWEDNVLHSRFSLVLSDPLLKRDV